MIEPLVYIILVNYNGYADTLECIKSICKINYKNYKIILVDNASSDVEKIKNDVYIQENAYVIYSDKNNGFSSGNNLGIEYAIENDAEYVLLLNNDTIVEKEFLKQLLIVAVSDKKIGIVTGDIFYYMKQDDLWYSCGNYNEKTNKTVMICNSSNEIQDVNFVCGCLALLSVKMIENIGMLDTSFFLYSEDTEYSLRAIRRNWRVVWTSSAKIYHKISASTGEHSRFKSYYSIRNNLYMIKRYSKIPYYAYIRRVFFEIKEVIRGRTSLVGLVWAIFDFIHNNMGKSNRF